MASDSEGEEYVYYGTPLEQEKSCPYFAKPSGPDHAAKTIALPVDQQEVRDVHGRQRLHGAFTGGYSAGYYNTVGSAVRSPRQLAAPPRAPSCMRCWQCRHAQRCAQRCAGLAVAE